MNHYGWPIVALFAIVIFNYVWEQITK